MKFKFIKTNTKRKILESLNEFYGITDLPYLLIESGKERIRAYSGHLSKEEITELSQLTHLESIGATLLKKEGDNIRPTFDSSTIIKNQVTKSIINLSPSDFKKWMSGSDLDLKTKSGIYLIRYKAFFLGPGKSNGSKLFNHVPKDRRIN